MRLIEPDPLSWKAPHVQVHTKEQGAPKEQGRPLQVALGNFAPVSLRKSPGSRLLHTEAQKKSPAEAGLSRIEPKRRA
jgi:hypothetical protein